MASQVQLERSERVLIPYLVYDDLVFLPLLKTVNEVLTLFDLRMQQLLAGEKVELTLVRHGQLLNLSLEVQAAIPETYVILLNSDIGRRQKTRLKAWLGRDLKFRN